MKRKSKIKRKTTGKTKTKSKKYDPLKKLKSKDVKLISKKSKSTGRNPRNIKTDLERKAIDIKGRRVSRWGNVYYEYRENRWDKNRKKGI